MISEDDLCKQNGSAAFATEPNFYGVSYIIKDGEISIISLLPFGFQGAVRL